MLKLRREVFIYLLYRKLASETSLNQRAVPVLHGQTERNCPYDSGTKNENSTS